MLGKILGTEVRVAGGVAVGCCVIVGEGVGVTAGGIVAAFVKGRVGYNVDARVGFSDNANDGNVVIVAESEIIVAVCSEVARAGRPHDQNIIAGIKTPKAWNISLCFMYRLHAGF